MHIKPKTKFLCYICGVYIHKKVVPVFTYLQIFFCFLHNLVVVKLVWLLKFSWKILRKRINTFMTPPLTCDSDFPRSSHGTKPPMMSTWTANNDFATQEVVTQSSLQICFRLLSPDKDFKCTPTSNNGKIQELFMYKSPLSMNEELNRGETPPSRSLQLLLMNLTKPHLLNGL